MLNLTAKQERRAKLSGYKATGMGGNTQALIKYTADDDAYVLVTRDDECNVWLVGLYAEQTQEQISDALIAEGSLEAALGRGDKMLRRYNA